MKKSAFFFLLLFCCTATLIARLYYVQIQNEAYRHHGDRTAVMALRNYANRGYIYDRNGEVLVANQSRYNLMVIPREVTELDTAALCQILQLDPSGLQARIQRCIQKNSAYRRSVFKRLLSAEAVAQFQELSYRFPGFYLQRNTLRTYPQVSSGNILGYLGEVNNRFLATHPGYQVGENTGIAGIEKSYERYLRGKPGVRFVRKDVRNRIVGPYRGGDQDRLPQAGEDLTTTLDIRLQRYGERLMKHKRGSIVALDPKTGEILALVTSPGYDPNLLVGSQKDEHYAALKADTLDKPLLARSLIGTYPPGSLFKLITALIGEQEGVLDPKTTTYICHDGFRVGHFHIGCHCGTSGHPIKLKTAIAKSCNNFFANVYWSIIKSKKTSALGLESWNQYVKSFGFGAFLHDDLPTGRPGYIPDSSRYNRMYGQGHWDALNTISNAIGQGEVLATPIQLANMAATLANRGWYYTPHIVQKIGGKPNPNPLFEQKRKTRIDPSYFGPVIAGMKAVIQEGTARFTAAIPGISLCGKTGTVQNPHGQDHSTFIGFAPEQNPVIAIAVIVENGYWGARWAAPIGSLMAEKYIEGAIKTPARRAIEKRMKEGDLRPEYQKQRLIQTQQKETATAKTSHG